MAPQSKHSDGFNIARTVKCTDSNAHQIWCTRTNWCIRQFKERTFAGLIRALHLSGEDQKPFPSSIYFFSCLFMALRVRDYWTVTWVLKDDLSPGHKTEHRGGYLETRMALYSVVVLRFLSNRLFFFFVGIPVPMRSSTLHHTLFVSCTKLNRFKCHLTLFNSKDPEVFFFVVVFYSNPNRWSSRGLNESSWAVLRRLSLLEHMPPVVQRCFW